MVTFRENLNEKELKTLVIKAKQSSTQTFDICTTHLESLFKDSKESIKPGAFIVLKDGANLTKKQLLKLNELADSKKIKTLIYGFPSFLNLLLENTPAV